MVNQSCAFSTLKVERNGSCLVCTLVVVSRKSEAINGKSLVVNCKYVTINLKSMEISCKSTEGSCKSVVISYRPLNIIDSYVAFGPGYS